MGLRGSSGPGHPEGLQKGEIRNMNSLVGKSTGIALLMAAALLVALFAMGVFSASGVGAQSTGPTLESITLVSVEADDTVTPNIAASETLTIELAGLDKIIGPSDTNQVSIEMPEDLGTVTGTEVADWEGADQAAVDLSAGSYSDGAYTFSFPAAATINRGVATIVLNLDVAHTIDTNTLIEAIWIGRGEEGDASRMDVGGIPEGGVAIDGAPDGPSITISPDTGTPGDDFYKVTITGADYDSGDTVTFTAANSAGDTVTLEDPGADGERVPGTAVTTIAAEANGAFSKVVFVQNQESETNVTITATVGTETTRAFFTVAAVQGEVKVSSDVAGDAVQVSVQADAQSPITSATDITIDLKGFGVPSSIPESSVNISDDSGDPDPAYVGEPNSVTVNGTKITLALYARFPGSTSSDQAGSLTDSYTVTFKQSAGITNPTTAGKKTINVKDADPTDETPSVVIKSKVKLSAAAGARGTAVTVSGVGLGKGGATVFLVRGACPDQGADPGKVAELEALQEDDPDATADDLPYADGTDCTEENDISLGNAAASGGKVSVDIDTSSSDFVRGNYPVDKTGKPIWVRQYDANGNVVRDSANRIVYEINEEVFEYDLRVEDEPEDSGDPDYAPYRPSDVQRGLNHITIVDGSGTNADKPAFFTITPTVMPDEDGVQQGDEMTILVEDWYYGSIADATITVGDERVVHGAYSIDIDTDGDGEFKFVVPNTARLGDQELKVTGTTRDSEGSLTALKNDVAKGRVIVGALDIEVEPSSVVLGQQFSVSVSGFIDENPPANVPAEITLVKVGDVVLEKTTGGEAIEDLTIDTNGDFTNTFLVEANDENAKDLKPGTYRVEVRDWSGRVAIGRITYPEPEIAVDPPVSRRGTTVTLTGQNFPAGRVVHVYYDDDTDEENLLGAVLADSAGNVRMNFTVPSNAEIGEEQDIIAKSQANEFQYKAKGTHALPEQELIVTPQAVSAGGRVSIEGHNMPLFTLVHLNIANINLSGQGVETDGLGSFTIGNVLIPQLKPGTHTVEAQVETQGDEPAKVREVIQIVDVVTRDSEEAFADLIENGTLTRVWHLDAQTQTWSFFDPAPEFADFNTLNQVSSGQIVTIIMSATDTFQARTLYPGSNPTNIE